MQAEGRSAWRGGARLKGQPEAAVPRLQPVTHREGSPTLAPAVQAAPGGGAGGALGGAKKRVSPAATLSHMTQLIMPQYANSLGITFGGQARRPWVAHHTRVLNLPHSCCA